ncbi:DUF2867 domain-containing protein [Salinispirillum marinum]|uniref:DUF2867 domain-containing protein n=2 Tax=Saccharospirillaceae TaxID=255527 RepID=A0ABV8BCH2_9GAMM
MKNHPTETEVPANSRIAELLDGASFYDAWSIRSTDVTLSALDHFIVAAKQTPRWIDACMILRNRLGGLVGLKNLGTLSGVAADKPASDFEPGSRVGIFTVFESRFDEALIGDKDKHLDVVLSIHRSESPDGKHVTITVTTVIHVKNRLGRIYMLPVKPMHRLIAPAVLAGKIRAEQAA